MLLQNGVVVMHNGFREWNTFYKRERLYEWHLSFKSSCVYPMHSIYLVTKGEVPKG